MPKEYTLQQVLDDFPTGFLECGALIQWPGTIADAVQVISAVHALGYLLGSAVIPANGVLREDMVPLQPLWPLVILPMTVEPAIRRGVKSGYKRVTYELEAKITQTWDVLVSTSEGQAPEEAHIRGALADHFLFGTEIGKKLSDAGEDVETTVVSTSVTTVVDGSRPVTDFYAVRVEDQAGVKGARLID